MDRARLASTVLTAPAWRSRQQAHEARVRVWTDPHQARAARGETHPVHDFLFHYYPHRPGWLRRWHPGIGLAVAAEGGEEFLQRRGYRRHEDWIAADPAGLPARRREGVAWIADLLRQSRDRPPFFACFGLHEWAMVYQLRSDDVRHAHWPLRFPPEEIARIVEAQTVCCSHFDAFRFFTPAARPLNRLQPTRADAPRLEQRGCLHANMDLYKWAFKLEPFTPSELVADCFELAWDIRAVDMRASPYDLASLGFPPIRIETPEGRADYEQRQRAFSARGVPLRERLIAVCDAVLAGWDPAAP